MTQPEPARRIPEAAFPGDAGGVAPEVAEAFASYAADPGSYPDVLRVLRKARLLVPVVAVLGEVEHDERGLAHDKTSDMAAVLLQGKDGRLALLAFTGLESLRAWNPDARPVPVAAQLAAQSAVQEQAAALLVDVAGPTTVVVEGEDLHGLAAGWTLARVGDRDAWLRPAD